jgi:hypothetical protein
MLKLTLLVVLATVPSLLLNMLLLTRSNSSQQMASTTHSAKEDIVHPKESMYKRSLHIPYFNNNANTTYSSFRCVGDDNDSGDSYTNRLCVFMNVCYDVKNEEMVYYRRSRKPILFDSKLGHVYNFTNNGRGFVGMHSAAALMNAPQFSWSPAIQEGHLPAEKDVHRVSGRLHAIWSFGHADINFGHICWEDIA